MKIRIKNCKLALFLRKRFALVVISILTAGPGVASVPTSDAVQELLVLSGSPQMVEMTKGQLAGMVSGPVQQTLQGQALTPEITAIAQACAERAAALVNEALRWEAVEPIFVEVYQATMTQEEVDGIVAFYKTPAGRAMIEKMPQLIQVSAQRMQQQLGPLVEQLQALEKETIARLQAEFAAGR
ncbi:MAG: DUF2059 domain-containing protein [Opitutales bacterium]